MRQKNVLIVVGLAILAVILIAVGQVHMVRVYRHYRADMLTYESRHMNSIVGAGAWGLDWTLESYAAQLEQMVNRREFGRAEEEYLEKGDAVVMRALMARPYVRAPFMRYSLAVMDRQGGAVLGATDAAFPTGAGGDEPLGENTVLRTDADGVCWFVFGTDSDNGFWYELAVQVQTVFAYHAETTRVGQHGRLFLLDKGGRFFAYSENGTVRGIISQSELVELADGIGADFLAEMDGRGMTGPDDYLVYRYRWEAYPQGTDETLVVTAALKQSGEGLVLGAAISFQEFNSILKDTLREVTWIILTEIAGALVLIFMAAWILETNRRSAMELETVRERADLMEEVNRQQQALAHGERLQQLGVMTSGIVHEFNNLMTPIMGHSLLLLEQLADRENSPEFESALDIYEASENARDTLRKMSVMGKKDVDMSFRVLELGALLKKTMILSSMAKDPHIVQKISLPAEPLYVSGNDQLLTQAFLNICINACQAMGEEGTLTIAASEEIRSGRGYARVEVSDTGPGISDERLSSIYDPFFTTKGEEGTGLGLAICRKIIETHKGTISAANGENGGAVFTVRIPVADQPAEE